VESIDVIPGISDHLAVKVIFNCNVYSLKPVRREVYYFKMADWDLLDNYNYNYL
jgi:hypothetical protein